MERIHSGDIVRMQKVIRKPKSWDTVRAQQVIPSPKAENTVRAKEVIPKPKAEESVSRGLIIVPVLPEIIEPPAPNTAMIVPA